MALFSAGTWPKTSLSKNALKSCCFLLKKYLFFYPFLVFKIVQIGLDLMNGVGTMNLRVKAVVIRVVAKILI